MIKTWVLPLLVCFALLLSCLGLDLFALVGALLGYLFGANAGLDAAKKEMSDEVSRVE